MSATNFVQLMDALELTEGNQDRYSLKEDPILGQRETPSKGDLGDRLEDLISPSGSLEPPSSPIEDIFSFDAAPALAQKKVVKGKVIRGTNKDDILRGTKGDDKIYGKGGSDILIGGKGNDFLAGGGQSGTRDQLTGGKGQDTFSLVQKNGSPGYLNDDALDDRPSRGFAIIHDFKFGEDKIELSGYASHYDLVPVFWGESFGSTSKADTAIIYKGPEQDKTDVVGVLKDVSLSAAYLQIPEAFTYVN
jgi:hypothetical protein